MYKSKYILALFSVGLCFSLALNAQQNGGDYLVKKTSSPTNNNITTGDNSATKISPEEKAKLEKKYSGNNFHINDEGVVVFTPATTKLDQDTNTSNSSQAIEEPLIDKMQENATSNSYNEIVEVNNDNSFIKKDKLSIAELAPPKATIKIAKADERAKTNKIEEPRKVEEPKIKPEKTVQGEVEKKTAPTEQKSTSTKKNPLQYKTLEEAILHTEANIEKIKGMMSTDLTNRIKIGKSANDKSSNLKNDQDLSFMTDAPPSKDFGVDMSYFINGVEVDKSEFLKLRSKDIISREIRTKGSSNPNGEMWIETGQK